MRQKQKVQYGAKAKKNNMGQKQNIHAEAKAENTSGPHDESPHGGGRRPPHIMWPASIFKICIPMYFLVLLHIVFSAFGPYCMFCFWPILYCISGPAGAQNALFFNFTVAFQM